MGSTCIKVGETKAAFRRLLAAIAALVAMTFMLAGPASAGPQYPVVRGDATVSATTVTAGGSVTVSGGGFGDCPVFLTVRVGNRIYLTETLTPDANGEVSASVRLTRTGRNVIELTGCTPNDETQVLDASVTVRSASQGAGLPGAGTGAGGGLPGTGGDLTSLYAGIGLLAAGMLLVSVTRQRRRVTS